MNPLEFLYYLGYSFKKRYAMNHQKGLPVKVISIGNITLGGTGKTPAVIAVAREAQKRGFQPCVLTRGYKGKAKDISLVSRGDGAILKEDETGDEAMLMAKKLKGIPIVKGKNRYEAGMYALTALPPSLNPNLFILDDGFQHWWLKRDKDIILIDSIKPFGNRRLFPLGILRETLGSISRADIIVLSRTDQENSQQTTGIQVELRKFNTKAPVFLAEHKPSFFLTMKGEKLPLDWAKEKTFYGFCGIGNPESFQRTLRLLGAKVSQYRFFRDHYKYTPDDIRKIMADADSAGADWIVTTEKDIMRIEKYNTPGNLVALAIEFEIGKSFYDALFTI